MTEQEIIKDNKLIAEFMGAILITPKNTELEPYYREFDIEGLLRRDTLVKVLKYHTSWNRLMPVVEKIESLFYSVSNQAEFWYDDETDTVNHSRIQYICSISNRSCNIIINSANYYHERLSKITATWYAVVEFIKWYNTQKTC